jgi:hypothetical protein
VDVSKIAELEKTLPRFWTSYWKVSNWEVNPEFKALWLSGSELFKGKGLSRGDFVYVISQKSGQLLLGGRMRVARIVPRDEVLRDPRAVQKGKKIENLYKANTWVVGEEGSGTPLKHHRRLTADVARLIRFVSPTADRFVSDKRDQLDPQTTRNVRELTSESASLLDEIIAITDHPSNLRKSILVDERFLFEARAREEGQPAMFPDEVGAGNTYPEGSVKSVLVNRYERDPKARRECIRHWGSCCFVCKMDFGAVYGSFATGLIHVHHLTPLSKLAAGDKVDPVKDLRSVCPNCHLVIHHKDPPVSLDEVKRFLRECLSSLS